MRKWDIDFSDIPIKELVRLPIRWGKLDLGGLFADIENELTQPIQWASYGKVILPDYASKILERWLSKTLNSEEVPMRFVYGEDDAEIANAIVNDIDHVARILLNSFETNRRLLRGAQEKLIRQLNDERTPLSIKFFKIGTPFVWPDFDPTWAIRELLSIARRPETLREDYRANFLAEFNSGVERLLEVELQGQRLERAKFALLGKCDTLWIDESHRIFGFYDNDFVGQKWTHPVDVNQPMARRILWELRDITTSLFD